MVLVTRLSTTPQNEFTITALEQSTLFAWLTLVACMTGGAGGGVSTGRCRTQPRQPSGARIGPGRYLVTSNS